MNFSQLFPVGYSTCVRFYSSLRHIYPSDFTLSRVKCHKILIFKISKTFSFSDIVILLKFDAQIDANGVSVSLNFKICRGQFPRTPLNSIRLAPPALAQYCMTKHKALASPLPCSVMFLP